MRTCVGSSRMFYLHNKKIIFCSMEAKYNIAIHLTTGRDYSSLHENYYISSFHYNCCDLAMCRWPRLSTCDAGTLPATDGWGQVYYEVTRNPYRDLCLCQVHVLSTRGGNKMLWFFNNIWRRHLRYATHPHFKWTRHLKSHFLIIGVANF